MARILLVDDEVNLLRMTEMMLRHEGHTVESHSTGLSALAAIDACRSGALPYDVVVTDYRLNDVTGLDVLRSTKAKDPSTQVLLVTAYATTATAVEAMRCGAYDYIEKPFKREEITSLVVSAAQKAAELRSTNIALRAAPSETHGLPNCIGRSTAMREVLALARRVAPTKANVLITGESGTGKEVIARAIHQLSGVKGAFIAVNCGAIPESLVESEFFGYAKGAFTGANRDKPGFFQAASQGTLFLDEIGELPPSMQVKLLRALQEKKVQRVGAPNEEAVSVRIIAATNEDLEAAVSEKRFRQDLFYRLHDFGITVPPLRDCQEDILPLAEFFREIANKELECNVSGFSSEARKALLTHAWPGNVRELRQKIMGAVLQAQEGVATKEHLELAVIKPTSHVSFALRNDVEDKERILRALKQANGNRSVAAELLGIGRTTLYSKLEEYGLKYKFKQS